MKTTINLIFVLYSMIQCAFAQTTETRQVGAFSNISAGRGLNVTLIPSQKEAIEVAVKGVALSDVLTYVEDQTLYVKMKAKDNKDATVQVYVEYKQLYEIESNTGSTIDTDGDIVADSLLLEAYTGGKITAYVQTGLLRVSSKASNVTAKGKADKQIVLVNTGGTYNGFELESNETEIKAATTAWANIFVINSLKADVTSKANVYYKGKPEKTEITRSLGGEITEVE